MAMLLQPAVFQNAEPVVFQNPVLDICPILMQERTISHYASLQKILLVGEGDFSFSSALASAFGTAVNIIATSLDSLDEVLTKYKWAGVNLSNLLRRGACLLHNIDGTKIALHPFISGLRFDRIVWNLPHAGFFGMPETDEVVIKKHKNLLESFFSNASKLLVQNGEVHVAHQSHGPYKKWELENLAERSGLKLKESVPFHPSTYPGYCNRRGAGIFAADTFVLGVSKTYKFVHSQESPTLRPSVLWLGSGCPKAQVVSATVCSRVTLNKRENADMCKENPQPSSRRSGKSEGRNSEAFKIATKEIRSEESKWPKLEQHQDNPSQDWSSQTKAHVSSQLPSYLDQRYVYRDGPSGVLPFDLQPFDKGSGVGGSRTEISGPHRLSFSEHASRHPGELCAREPHVVHLNRTRDAVGHISSPHHSSFTLQTSEYTGGDSRKWLASSGREKFDSQQCKGFIKTSQDRARGLHLVDPNGAREAVDGQGGKLRSQDTYYREHDAVGQKRFLFETFQYQGGSLGQSGKCLARSSNQQFCSQLPEASTRTSQERARELKLVDLKGKRKAVGGRRSQSSSTWYQEHGSPPIQDLHRRGGLADESMIEAPLDFNRRSLTWENGFSESEVLEWRESESARELHLVDLRRKRKAVDGRRAQSSSQSTWYQEHGSPPIQDLHRRGGLADQSMIEARLDFTRRSLTWENGFSESEVLERRLPGAFSEERKAQNPRHCQPLHDHSVQNYEESFHLTQNPQPFQVLQKPQPLQIVRKPQPFQIVQKPLPFDFVQNSKPQAIHRLQVPQPFHLVPKSMRRKHQASTGSDLSRLQSCR